jgi:hypothetical protein
MNPRICICCGEPLLEKNEHSRNPNVCASCSSLADGMDELALNVVPEPEAKVAEMKSDPVFVCDGPHH